jgi:hypothetical protein
MFYKETCFVFIHSFQSKEPCIVNYHVLYLLSVHFVIYVKLVLYMLTSCNTYIVSEGYLINTKYFIKESSIIEH